LPALSACPEGRRRVAEVLVVYSNCQAAPRSVSLRDRPYQILFNTFAKSAKLLQQEDLGASRHPPDTIITHFRSVRKFT